MGERAPRSRGRSRGARLCCVAVLLLAQAAGAGADEMFVGGGASLVLLLEGAGYPQFDLHAGLVTAGGFGVRLSAGLVRFADPVAHVQLDVRYRFRLGDDATQGYLGAGPDLFIGDGVAPLAHLTAGVERRFGQLGLFAEAQFNWIYPSVRVGIGIYGAPPERICLRAAGIGCSP